MAIVANLDRSSSKTVQYAAKNNNSFNTKRAKRVIVDHYRCPEEFVNIDMSGNPSEHPGFFRFGPDAVCYGRCSAFVPSHSAEFTLDDALKYVNTDQRGIALPFDIAEAVSALRYERYTKNANGARAQGAFAKLVRTGYYAIRPAMSVSVRKHLQRYSLRNWDRGKFPRWPVDRSVEATIETALALNLQLQKTQQVPFIWFWPDGAQACAVMTHDIETAVGRDFCDRLMDIDDSYGVKSSFQVIPERRYTVPNSYLKKISRRGFEINVHDLYHDGNLFKDYEEFSRRAASINTHARRFEAKGFRAGALYRNIDWLELLDFEYDMSLPNVAHLDPQRGGCCTIFPYFIGRILEIPVTVTQDYSLFNILRSYSLDLWEKQMAMIREKHGMMNFIVHPDYILNEREQGVYRSLLGRISELRETAGLWVTLPGEVNKWWRQRSLMKLQRKNGGWEIVGEGKERARIACARLENGKLVYSL